MNNVRGFCLRAGFSIPIFGAGANKFAAVSICCSKHFGRYIGFLAIKYVFCVRFGLKSYKLCKKVIVINGLDDYYDGFGCKY